MPALPAFAGIQKRNDNRFWEWDFGRFIAATAVPVTSNGNSDAKSFDRQLNILISLEATRDSFIVNSKIRFNLSASFAFSACPSRDDNGQRAKLQVPCIWRFARCSACVRI